MLMVLSSAVNVDLQPCRAIATLSSSWFLACVQSVAGPCAAHLFSKEAAHPEGDAGGPGSGLCPTIGIVLATASYLLSWHGMLSKFAEASALIWFTMGLQQLVPTRI